MTGVRYDGVFRYDREVLAGDDVPGVGSADEDVCTRSSVFHCRNLETRHGGLEGVDWVDLGDKNASAVRSQRLGALERIYKNKLSYQWQLATYPLPEVTVASNSDILSGKHDVDSTLNTIDEGLAVSVAAVKPASGNGVVDVDSGRACSP